MSTLKRKSTVKKIAAAISVSLLGLFCWYFGRNIPSSVVPQFSKRNGLEIEQRYVDKRHDASQATATSGPSVIEVARYGTTGLPVQKNEILVRISDPTTVEQLTSFVAKWDSSVLGSFPRSGLYRLQVPPDSTLDEFLYSVRSTGIFNEVLPHAVTEATSCTTGEYYPIQWNLHRIEHEEACSHQISKVAPVTVAVLDTGIAYRETTESEGIATRIPDLALATFAEGYDFINRDEFPDDDNLHGTHVAASIAASGEATGVAPNVTLMPVKVLNRDRFGTEMTLVEGLYYAVDHGAQIINASLSFGPGFFPSSALQDAIAYAKAHNTLIVASSGNRGLNDVLYPAAFPDVIAVGSSRMSVPSVDDPKLGFHASYSNYGYALDLVAPGGMISTDFDFNNYPDAILAQGFTHDDSDAAQFSYILMAGTSQSAAMVSGALAWLLGDGQSAAQASYALQRGANPMRVAHFDPKIGSGELRIQGARDVTRTFDSEPHYYTNLLVWFETIEGGQLRASARIQVMNEDGMPAVGVHVGGSWLGSFLGSVPSAVTDSAGIALVYTPALSRTTELAIGFRLDAVFSSSDAVPHRPTQFYALTPAEAELYARLLADADTTASALVFELLPTDEALGAVLDLSTLHPTYAIKPIGAGLVSGPMVVAFDATFAPDITQPDPNNVTEIHWQLPSALASGRGLIQELSGRMVTRSSTSLGQVSRYFLFPMDPLMPRMDFEASYPVINALELQFASENMAVGNSLQELIAGEGFAYSSLGNGFFSASLGDGFATTNLGDAFTGSSLGNGFAYSSIGNGFAANVVGEGLLATALSNGFAYSSLGNGFAYSSIGNGESWSAIEAQSKTSKISSSKSTTILLAGAPANDATATPTPKPTPTPSLASLPTPEPVNPSLEPKSQLVVESTTCDVTGQTENFGTSSLAESMGCKNYIHSELEMYQQTGEHAYPPIINF